ncbi:MAG TPA: type IV secretion system DNA-binding domain-containing protein [Steroidobacteraceae bacterium]|nr:type IV secretion system DNA-binding domain-containing protein [Steroidobacteraceae bacterium]
MPQLSRERSEMDFSSLQGWSGTWFTFASVQTTMWIGLARGRAGIGKYLISPLVAAPLTAAAAVGMACASPLLSKLGISPHGVLNFAFGTALSAWVGYSGGRAAVEEVTGSKVHERGAVVTTLHRRGLWSTKSRDKDGQIALGDTSIPLSDEPKHFKLIGTTGTGKSTAIQGILSGALSRGDRAVIADPDGGYLKRFYDPARGDVVLNPFEPHSVKWDLFGEIKSLYDVDQLARALIPDHGGQDRSWRGYGRTFFSAVARQMHEGGLDDVGELYRLLVVADPGELRTLVKGTPAQPFLDEDNSKMFDSIRSVTSSAVGAIEFVARQNATKFAIRDWVNSDSPGNLFIPYKAGQIAALRTPISAWMRIAIFEAMNQEEHRDEREEWDSRRLWFVVDELDALGQIDGLKDALARLRKFGGRCVLGFQSIAQVSSTYGQGDAHTIVENCGNTLILRCSASEGGGTARFASQLIGDREVMRTTISRSRRYGEAADSISQSEHFNVEPAVMPSQIEQLPDLAGYLKIASDPRWHQVRLDALRRWNERGGGSGGGSGPGAGAAAVGTAAARTREGNVRE